MKRALLLAPALALSACAGSVTIERCEPEVCSADCDIDDEECSVFDLEIVTGPGATHEVTAFARIEGSYAGDWTFDAASDGPVTLEVNPTSATVDGSGEEFPFEVTIRVDGEAAPGRFSVSLQADRGDVSASTSVLFEIPDGA